MSTLDLFTYYITSTESHNTKAENIEKLKEELSKVERSISSAKQYFPVEVLDEVNRKQIAIIQTQDDMENLKIKIYDYKHKILKILENLEGINFYVDVSLGGHYISYNVSREANDIIYMPA